MKKYLFTFLILEIGFYFVSGQTLLEELTEYNIRMGDVQDVDINADGYLDIFIGGYDQSGEYERIGIDGKAYKYRTVLLMWSDDQGKFIETESNFESNSRQYAAFTDFTGNNILDLAFAHHEKITAFPADWGIYIGDSNGNFDKIPMKLDDEEYNFYPKGIAVADVNLDGKPDIIAFGCSGTYGTESFDDHSAILINDGFEGESISFKVTGRYLFTGHAFEYLQVQVLDITNDGYPDFILSSKDDSDMAISDGTFLDIYVNKGDNAPGEFERIKLCEEMGAAPQYLGPIAIQDFNSDGFLDIFITGKNGSTVVAPMNLYLNNGDGTFAKSEQVNFRANLRNENNTPNQGKGFDWSGNGYPDIIVSGYDPDGYGTQAGLFFENDGSANFGEASRLPGGSNASIGFPDWDGNGVRDLFIQGKSTSSDWITQSGVHSMVTKGFRANERPSPPSNLSVLTNENNVTLSWDAGEDDKTPSQSLSYEYYIKNSDGVVYNNCRSIIGGELDGSRMVLALGNAFLSKSVTLRNLPPDEYSWGVQAIDACFEGSAFATGTFTISESTDIEQVQDLSAKLTVNNQILTIKTGNINSRLRITDTTGRIWVDTYFDHSYSQKLTKGIYIVTVKNRQKINAQKTIIM